MTLNGYVPMRRGLLNHLQEGRMSLFDYLVYTLLLLLADRKTGTAMTNAGGIVYFTGNQMPLRTAQGCLQRLESRGYIKRPFRVQGRRAYDAIFIDKFVCTDGALRDMRLSFENTTDWNNPAYVRCAEGAGSVRSGCGLGAPIQEERIENNKTSTSKPDGSDHADGSGVDVDCGLFLPALPKNKNGGADPSEAALVEVFNYYVEHLGRDPLRYELTTKRRKKGLARLEDCMRHSKDRSVESGVGLMKVAIDRLARSPHHNGQNDTGTTYVEWDSHLLRRDWHDFYAFWLDDAKWNRRGGEQ